jgi:dihydropteroate synthase
MRGLSSEHHYRTSDLPNPGRCVVMGIVNVTANSFSDGGMFLRPSVAVARGLDLLQAGADLIDVGGESTRPGAERVTLKEELRRVLPVVTDLAALGAVVSIDTMRAEVAEAACAAGAQMVNDVSGGQADSQMPAFVAEAGVPYVLMHWRGHSREMGRRAVYDDVVAEVAGELRMQLDVLVSAGVGVDKIVLDPGLGFAKTSRHNWGLLANLDALHALGRPLLIGASRKRFLGELLAGPDGVPRPVDEREAATAAVSALAAAKGAWGVRVHEVRATSDAVKVAAAMTGLARERNPEDRDHG